MVKKILKMILNAIIIAALVFLVVLVISSVAANLSTRSLIFNPEDSIPAHPVAIIFGAGLNRDGTPSTVLRDRVATGVDLYKTGKVRKLLMSGDNRFLNYNEPGAMQQYAISLGVPETDIVLDFAGRRTYDTCYRAKHIFQVESAVLVSQDYHLPRAVFTCKELGLPAIGVRADRRTYRSLPSLIWKVREMPATLTAFVEVWLTHPLPVLGKPEPIFLKPQSEE
ncbi:MAG: vancomycin high temperature exclusion protein [Anaerolineaceae bacterium]